MTVQLYIQMTQDFEERIFVPYLAALKEIKENPSAYSPTAVQRAGELELTLANARILTIRARTNISARLDSGTLDLLDEIDPRLLKNSGVTLIDSTKAALDTCLDQIRRQK